MSRSIIRLVIVSAAISIAAACSSPVAPSTRAVQAAHRNDSGYLVASGRTDSTAIDPTVPK